MTATGETTTVAPPGDETAPDQTAPDQATPDQATPAETPAAETTPDQQGASVACSFCLKSAADVGTMVAGPGVFICDECVQVCVEIIATKPAKMPTRADWEQNLDDDGLLALLPKVSAAGAQVDRQLTTWVRKGRARGITWTRIGTALGMTRQSAWERFSGEE
jgi:hypothetical protein